MKLLQTRLAHYIFNQKSGKMFMSFEEFKEGLGSWAEPLKHFTDSKTFQDIYKYVKGEYESGKKVCMGARRYILHQTLSSMPSRPLLSRM